jgi:hypothetical protein
VRRSANSFSLTWGLLLAVAACMLGCGGEAPVASAPPVREPDPPTKQARPIERPVNASPKAQQPAVSPRAAPPREERSLADLIPQAQSDSPPDPMRFDPPEIDEPKARGRGLRKLVGKHLTLYTDLPSSPAVDELPHVFDLAVPQWMAYFHIEPERAEKWHMVGSLAREKEKFFDTGVWPDDLPPFPNGYMRDNQLWLYEQPSEYYRRHLLLHEGVHGLMWAFLGGMGPVWYTEGMAELLGTHIWDGEQLTVNVVPESKESSPMWGRVKIIRDAYAAEKAHSLATVMSFPPRSHSTTEGYGWSWAAALFFDHDPLFRDAFREQREAVGDVTLTFSERLLNRLPEPREQIAERWECFVANLDYGYDAERESLVRRDVVAALPSDGGEAEIAADRGWQSTGFQLSAGKTYTITAAGRFQIGRSTRPWISEPDGITLRYHRGEPIGRLMAAVTDEGRSPRSGLTRPTAIGRSGEITPAIDGVLYLRVNDSPADLADNAGTLQARVRAK